MTSPLDEKAEHPRIWLEPAGSITDAARLALKNQESDRG
jgi:hypothetical protein